MSKSNILNSLELLSYRKQSTASKRQSTATPTPGPSPELPQTTPSPDMSSGKTEDASDLPDNVSSTRQIELFRRLNGYYDQQSQSSGNARTSATSSVAKTTAVPGIVKPADRVDTGSLVMMTDGGKAGTSSDGFVYDPKTGQSSASGKSSSSGSNADALVLPTAGIPDAYADIAEIVALLPEGFDLTDWDDKTAVSQRKALQNSGLSSEDMMTLLNSATSLETIATVQDIQANRTLYGLTQADADSICAELFEITNARIGAKTHAMPFSNNARLTRIFLDDLDEKEADLFASFAYDKSDRYTRESTPNVPYAKRDPLPVGEYIDYNKVDLTDDLNDLMHESAAKFQLLRAKYPNNEALVLLDFILNVKTGGPMDIKNQDDWKFQDAYTYYFNGIQMRNDDPGNILFGYAGAALYGATFLEWGAGKYQMYSDQKKYGEPQFQNGFHDDPRDTAMIQYGYDLYMEDHKEDSSIHSIGF